MTVHLESESINVFTSKLQFLSVREEKGDLSVYTLLYVGPANSIQRVLLTQKPSEEQCVTGCQSLPTERF